MSDGTIRITVSDHEGTVWGIHTLSTEIEKEARRADLRHAPDELHQLLDDLKAALRKAARDQETPA